MTQSPVPSSQPITRYSPADRPTWFDFYFILVGFTLSLILIEWSPFAASDTATTPPFVKQHLLNWLPRLMFLPFGPLLLWPIFWLTQWLRGRQDPVSGGEWLWGVAWLGLVPLVGWFYWQHWDELQQRTTMPEPLQPANFKIWILIGYAVGVLALGSSAALITLIGMVFRWRRPWTHAFCLVLLIWQALWLACCMVWGIELK